MNPTEDTRSKSKVLLVDDEFKICAPLAGALVEEGFEVVFAESGDEAMAAFRDGIFEIALMDLRMPGKSGWERLAQLASTRPLLPIIIITAHPDQEAWAKAAGVGALLDFPVLLETVRRLLSEPIAARFARLEGKAPLIHEEPRAIGAIVLKNKPEQKLTAPPLKTHHTINAAPCPSTRLLAQVTALALFAASGGSGLAAVTTKAPADLALLRLKVGNAKFVDNISTRANKTAQRRVAVAKGEKPFAIVVSCSDSRVGPEVVFNQGLGDLFVVRTAGHVVDGVGLGSIEYAVEHLGAALILVLGHERCGAVAATVAGGKAHGQLPAIVKAIKPAVAKTKGQPGDAVDNAVREHVRAVAAQLQKAGPVLATRVQTGQLKVVGAHYDLDTGRVQLIE